MISLCLHLQSCAGSGSCLPSAGQVKRQAQEAAPRQQGGSVFRSLLGLDEDKVPAPSFASSACKGLARSTPKLCCF